MRSLLLLTLLSFQALAEVSVPDVHVVSYHDVRAQVAWDYDPDQYAVSTANLIEQFSWLRDNGYTVVSADAVISAYTDGTPLPPNAVLLTFDDGLVSFYHTVYPLLKLFNYPAVVSVVTSWIGNETGIDYASRQRYAGDFLNWDQIREMQASGLVEVASHSHDLHRGIQGNPQGNMQPAAVTRLFEGNAYESESAYRKRIKRDLKESVETILENTGKAPRVMTWPYGALSDIAAEVAADLGMQVNLTLSADSTVRDESLLLGRYLVMANPSLGYFSAEFTLPPVTRVVRVAQVDLDYIYDADPEQQSRNLDRLLDRIKALEISHVFLQAFSDTDADGAASAVYFPNRHLPVRADLFNRVAWQLRTRSNVRVFAWMPILSFVGESFESDWRVVQQKGEDLVVDENSEPRLSPFNPKARKRIAEVYEDLAIHAHFDGILFHDDGRMNEFEDFSSPARKAFKRELGQAADFDRLLTDEGLKQAWAQLKSETINDFTDELADRVRQYHPDVKTARNIFASALLDDDAIQFLAQDYDAFLESYDFVALMAMPELEGAPDEKRFLEDLVDAVSTREDGLDKTIFELQTVYWRDSRRIDSDKIQRTMRWLQSLGVRHLGYYPDDFIIGHPSFEALRSGLSLADEYGVATP